MNKGAIGFSLIGSVMTIVFLGIVNMLTSPDTIWFIIPSFFLLLWPGALLFAFNRQYKLFSLFGSILFISFLISNNYLYSPETPWFLYAIYPVIWWPIAMYAGKRAATFSFAVVASLCTIMYYSVLNMLLSPQHLWAIFPAFAVLWWPLSIYFAQRRQFFQMSVAASFMSVVFFVTVNAVFTPGTIWAVYPIFGLLWWPLSMHYFYDRKKRSNSTDA